MEKKESLYLSNKKQLQTSIKVIEEQLKQKENELQEEKSKVTYLEKGYDYILKEIKVTEPMVKRGIESDLNFLKLKREANDLKEKLESARFSIPKTRSKKLNLNFKTEQKKSGMK